MCLFAECFHDKNRVQVATYWVTKVIFCILALEIFKRIICGKYGSNGEFLTVDGLSKTMTYISRKLQERNLNKMSFTF